VKWLYRLGRFALLPAGLVLAMTAQRRIFGYIVIDGLNYVLTFVIASLIFVMAAAFLTLLLMYLEWAWRGKKP